MGGSLAFSAGRGALVVLASISRAVNPLSDNALGSLAPLVANVNVVSSNLIARF
jgi:hypothetical protein